MNLWYYYTHFHSYLSPLLIRLRDCDVPAPKVMQHRSEEIPNDPSSHDQDFGVRIQAAQEFDPVHGVKDAAQRLDENAYRDSY